MVDTNTDTTTEEEIKTFSCGKCRTKLFTSDKIQGHISRQKRFEARKDKMNKALSDIICQSYFIDMDDWMNLPEDGVTQQGKI